MRNHSVHHESPQLVRTAIVDDHAFIRELMCRELARHSELYQVVASVGTAAEAIAACRNLIPSVLILDINLPDRSGVAIVPEIKKISSKIRVLLCSAFAREDWLTQATACGADGFVEKTNTWDDFLVALQRVARGERYFAGGGQARTRPSLSDAASAAGITVREREILGLIADGLTTKEIAAQLSISVPTVETHRGNLMTKTGARNVAALVRFAMASGATTE